MSATHEVLNQPPPLVDYDLFTTDAALTAAVRREGAAWAGPQLSTLGARLGQGEVLALGEQANRQPPVLHAFDRFGRRRDEVEFHPAWHAMLRLGVEAGLHGAPWGDGRTGAHVARAAGFFLLTQVEAGVGCPLAMTYAAVPTLRLEPAVAAVWEPRLATRVYDPRPLPVAEKADALVGMAMTEKQGGSDVRANTTRAVPSPDGGWWLTGHKWFCSAPMSDAFLVLGQAPEGLTCFLLPRVLPDGTRNGIRLQRLKDKLGNRSNASAEIELEQAWAARVGPPGRGVPTIIEMVACTRLDCALGSAALLRQAVAQATHHALYRAAFGRRLAEQPLMRNVLADLVLESEAATALALRVAGAFDRATDPHEAALRRLATPAAKYWICKRTPVAVVEVMEVLGGNGYVEESLLPRLYREAPVNSIWEGSGNVMCLDVLRALAREPGVVDALLTELRGARGGDPRLDTWVASLERDLRPDSATGEIREGAARRLTERVALALQAALLVRHGPAPVADAFCASRLGGDGGRAFGTLPAGTDWTALVERALPASRG